MARGVLSLSGLTQASVRWERGAIARDLKPVIERVAAICAEQVVINLSLATPVYTGLAASSWLLGIGGYPTGLEFLEGASGPPSTREPLVPSAAAGQAAGLEALRNYRLEQGSIFITNPVPYINKLAAGSSPQAPAGYVTVEVERAVTETEGIIGSELG